MTDQEKSEKLLDALHNVVRLEREKVRIEHALAIALVTLQEAKDLAYEDRFSAVTGRKNLG